LPVIPGVQSNSAIPVEIQHDEYIKQIDFIIDQIHQGNFEKVVLSRVKVVDGSYREKLAELFEKLCTSYPNAFVYIFNIKTELWIGATPEPLLNSADGIMNTVSLAGTKPFTQQNLNIGAWNSKERLEHEYVTRYITKVLSKFNLKNVELEGPYIRKAGNLLHIRADFSFSSNELNDRLGDFISQLHPTPAVCGMPRNTSLKLITDIEKHRRDFYTGFLGPVGIQDSLWLFVNLRCMKVLPEHLALFVGGGITADSVPEDEWQETEIKAETLLSIIKKL
jgi:isochorismate synthase